ncbi:MAG: hypothetical protein K2X87_10140, partial [Gemmataceae bacterium]|nr:hypothetical protein [Gemmataceae bacterium]
GAALTIDAGGADDVIHLGSQATPAANAGGRLDTFRGTRVTVRGGAGSDDTLTVAATQAADLTAGLLTPTRGMVAAAGVAGRVEFEQLDGLRLLLGGQADAVRVTGTITPVTVDLGGGDDAVTVAAAAHAVAVTTGAGDDAVTVFDTAGGVSATGDGPGTDALTIDRRAITAAVADGRLTGNTITGVTAGAVTFAEVDRVAVLLGTGNDRLTVNAALPTTLIELRGGGGDDAVVFDAIAAPAAAGGVTATYFGGGGEDVARVVVPGVPAATPFAGLGLEVEALVVDNTGNAAAGVAWAVRGGGLFADDTETATPAAPVLVVSTDGAGRTRDLGGTRSDTLEVVSETGGAVAGSIDGDRVELTAGLAVASAARFDAFRNYEGAVSFDALPAAPPAAVTEAGFTLTSSGGLARTDRFSTAALGAAPGDTLTPAAAGGADLFALYQIDLWLDPAGGAGPVTVTFTGVTANGRTVTFTPAADPAVRTVYFPASFTALRSVSWTAGHVAVDNLVARVVFAGGAGDPAQAVGTATLSGVVAVDTAAMTINGVGDGGSIGGVPLAVMLDGGVLRFRFAGNLAIGAGLYGLLSGVTPDQVMRLTSAAVPAGALAAVVRLDLGPAGYDADYTGFDVLAFVNLSSVPLPAPRLGAVVAGAGAFTLALQVDGVGAARVLTSLAPGGVGMTLVPDDAADPADAFQFVKVTASVGGAAAGLSAVTLVDGQAAFLTATRPALATDPAVTGFTAAAAGPDGGQVYALDPAQNALVAANADGTQRQLLKRNILGGGTAVAATAAAVYVASPTRGAVAVFARDGFGNLQFASRFDVPGRHPGPRPDADQRARRGPRAGPPVRGGRHPGRAGGPRHRRAGPRPGGLRRRPGVRHPAPGPTGPERGRRGVRVGRPAGGGGPPGRRPGVRRQPGRRPTPGGLVSFALDTSLPKPEAIRTSFAGIEGLAVSTAGGADTITLRAAPPAPTASTRIGTGGGGDRVVLVGLSATTTVDLGDGADEAQLRALTAGAAVSVLGGAGADVIVLEQAGAGTTIAVAGGPDADTVRVSGRNLPADAAVSITGDGGADALLFDPQDPDPATPDYAPGVPPTVPTGTLAVTARGVVTYDGTEDVRVVAAPVIALGPPPAIDEGDGVTLTATVTPLGTAGVLDGPARWDLDGDGVFNDGVGTTLTLTWGQLGDFGLADDGVYQVGLTATNADGFTSRAYTTLTVRTRRPAVTVSGPAAAVVGSPVTVTFAATDPGDDRVGEWRVTWGDGSVETFGSDTRSAAHEYRVPGVMAVVVAAVDEDTAPDGTDSNVLLIDVAVDPATASAGGPYLVAEGGSLTLSATASGDPTGFAWDLNRDGDSCSSCPTRTGRSGRRRRPPRR